MFQCCNVSIYACHIDKRNQSHNISLFHHHYLPGILFGLSRWLIKCIAWPGNSVVCWLGLCWLPTSLASTLLWATPAQPVTPSSWYSAERMSAAICEPTASRWWHPHWHSNDDAFAESVLSNTVMYILSNLREGYFFILFWNTHTHTKFLFLNCPIYMHLRTFW